MAVDFLPKRDILEVVVPADAASISSGTIGNQTWSSYRQIITAANLTYDFILCGIYTTDYYSSDISGNNYGIVNYEVATGAIGSEQPIADVNSFLFGSEATIGTGMICITSRTIPIAPTLIPKNTRIAVRFYNNSAGMAWQCNLYLVGYKASQWAKPLTYLKDQTRYMKGLSVVGSNGTTGATVLYPQTGTINVTAGSPAWTFGTPVEFRGPNTTAITNPTLITGAFMQPATPMATQLSVQLQVYTGSAGNEVPQAKMGGPGAIWTIMPLQDCYLPRPTLIFPGERLSVAAECITASKVVPVLLRGIELK